MTISLCLFYLGTGIDQKSLKSLQEGMHLLCTDQLKLRIAKKGIFLGEKIPGSGYFWYESEKSREEGMVFGNFLEYSTTTY